MFNICIIRDFSVLFIQINYYYYFSNEYFILQLIKLNVILIFYLSYEISRWRSIGIHGNKSQNERDHTLNQFRSGQANILVATDVAARGLGKLQ